MWFYYDGRSFNLHLVREIYWYFDDKGVVVSCYLHWSAEEMYQVAGIRAARDLWNMIHSNVSRETLPS